MLSPRRAAHFLLTPELADSPPNDTLIRAYRELGLEIDLYAPGDGRFRHSHGDGVRTFSVEYGYRWLARHALRPAWRRYAVFSGTAEDPIAVVRTLAASHRRPAVALVDEIKAGSYRGDARESWKRLCRSGIRRADVVIVNDASRIDLLRDYAGLAATREILVYPGSYLEPPAAVDRRSQRQVWNLPTESLVVASSGGFNFSMGADWLVDAVQALPELHAVIQPLGVDPLVKYLLPRLRSAERLYVEPSRLGWRQAWAQAAACDIGMAIYLSAAPQFQHMGTSSNRLCMFLAMGVPVIASRQESFRFLEEYDCGLLVETSREFAAAVGTIASRLETMKANARRCWAEHVCTAKRYRALVGAIGASLR